MLKGMNKVFEKHQKLLLTVVGIIIIVPFIGFVPGADLFDLFGESDVEISVNGESLDTTTIQQQNQAYQLGLVLGVPQNYVSKDLFNNEKSQSIIALQRFALIKKLKAKYDFNSIMVEDIKQFLKSVSGTTKQIKNYLKNIQQRLGLTPKQMEVIVVENYFIKKNDEEIKSTVVIDESKLEEGYHQQYTKYTIDSLKLVATDSQFFDASAQQYYDAHKQDYARTKALKVAYVNINTTKTGIDDIDNLEKMINDRFNKNKANYSVESHQKKVGIIGLTIDDFSNVKESTVKFKLMANYRKEMIQKGFEAIRQEKEGLDSQSSFWFDDQKNTFTKFVRNLKVGEVSSPILIRNTKGYPDGYYLIQVLEQRQGVVTNWVRAVIGEEIVREKNEVINKHLAKNLHHSVAQSIKSISSVKERKNILTEKAKVLNLIVRSSPFIEEKQDSKAYSTEFVKEIFNLSEKNPLSKVMKNNNKYVFALFDEKRSPYKPLATVKSVIKEKIYAEKAKAYYDNNKEVFKVPTIKYGLAVNFYSNVKDFKVSNEDTIKYYKDNSQVFKQKQAQVRVISLDYKQDKKIEIKAQLEKIIADIKAKVITFQEAAIKYSQDKQTNSNQKGDSLVWVTQNSHVTSDVIFKTAKQQISDIYIGSNTLKVFFVENTSDNISFPRAKDYIISLLQRQRAVKDATAKKTIFYNNLEMVLSNKGKEDFAKNFRELANNSGYGVSNISTTNKSDSIRTVVADLEVRDIDNPLIINDNDFWIACYERTELAKLMKFDNPSTKQQAIIAVNKEDAIDRLNKKFNKIFNELNNAKKESFEQLIKTAGLTQEDAISYKDLSQAYKGFVDSQVASNKIFATKDNNYDHIIFRVKAVQKSTAQQFEQSKKEFAEQYKAQQQEKIIREFYDNFINNNIVSL